MNKLIDRLLSWCTLPILGLVITACYLLGTTWLLFDRLEPLKTMPLNEIGDFLAGVFGALAFFWLVIGYFMQNRELSLNREELIISRKSLVKQAEELNNSVKEQREIVRLTKMEMKNEKNSQLPVIEITSSYYYPSGSMMPHFGGSSKTYENTFRLYLKNHGSEVRNSYLLYESSNGIEKTEIQQIKDGANFTLITSSSLENEFSLKLIFLTRSLTKHYQILNFKMKPDSDNELIATPQAIIELQEDTYDH